MGKVKLNEQQKKAVDFNGGDLLIIAGAGTGKTSVLTQRIINIIKKGWAKPNEILALTFTEKAATEMQDRVEDNLEYGVSEPTISTFHSFCDSILREDGYNIGLDGGYELMSTAQAYIFLRKHLYELPLNTLSPKGSPTMFINNFLKHVSRLQDEDVSPEDYLQYASSLPQNTVEEKEEYIKTKELAETYQKYSELKVLESKADFGDLIILTLKLFRERRNILEKYRKQYKYILVDEYQDTNYTQNVLINTLVLGLEENNKKDVDGPRPLLTVVGDDDQSIYKFRGAAISNILQFKKTYKDATEIVLVDNYRSKQEILDSAYTLVTHNNPYRLEVTENINKKLVAMAPFDDDQDAVMPHAYKTEQSEARGVVNEILKLTGYEEYVDNDEESDSQAYDEKGQSSFLKVEPKKGKYLFSDIAILVRANNSTDAFIQALRNKGVPYKLGGSRALYSRNEIKNLIAYLKILVDFDDEIQMYRLLRMPIWHLSPREYISLENLAKEDNNTSIMEELERLWNIRLGDDNLTEEDIRTVDDNLLKTTLTPEAVAGVSTLLELIDSGFKKIKENKSIVEILYDFVMDSGYMNTFLDNSDDPESLFAVSNINKFFDTIKSFEKNNQDTNLQEFVNYLDYSIEIGESPNVDEVDIGDVNAVNIMTVHASKGLEFPVVFLVNLVKDKFPARGRADAIPIPDGLIKEVGVEDMDEKEQNIQEERRLFYVGVTRAKEKLYLTAANYYEGAKRKKKPSMFLEELLDRNVDKEFDQADKKDDSDSVFNMKFVNNPDYGSIIGDTKMDLAKRFSYSQLNTYQKCPRKYEYANVIKIPSKPYAATSFGTSIHNTLRDFYTILIQSKTGLNGIIQAPTLQDLLALYEKNWVHVGYESSKHEKIQKNKGIEILKNYYENCYSAEENPYKLEQKFNLSLCGTVFSGQIDRMDVVDIKDDVVSVCIVDYKTGKDKDSTEIKHDMQLPLYAVCAENAFNVKVVGAKYIFVESCHIIDVDVSADRRLEAQKILADVLQAIRDRKFVATPDFLCNYCDYSTICDYANV